MTQSAQDRSLGTFADLSGSAALFVAAHSNRVQSIYGVLLAGVIALFVALPLVHVTVSVSSNGMIRPELEKQVLRARTAGFILHVHVENNQSVRVNDTLLVLDEGPLSARNRVQQAQVAERHRVIRDLESLSAGVATSPESVVVHTPLGGAEKTRYLAERHRLLLTAQEAIRQRTLIRGMGKLASVDEVKRREADLAQAESELGFQTERTIADWSARIRTETDNAQEIQSQLTDLQRQRGLFVLLSPVSGTAEQVASMSPGGFVQVGDELLQISPDTKIVAEMTVSARDIGMLSVGMPVRMMIDAFDYNSWGVATGRIRSISHDATVVDHQALYSVRCSIDQPALTLKNGYRGKIQKGMSLRARFVVARRSIFDLLYDRVDRWLNPSLAPEAA